MIKRLLVSTALAIMIMLLTTSPVLAIAPPDSVATIDAVNVYRSCLETNDQLYVIEYTITYAALPDETIDEAYIFRLTNGIVELRSTTAYAYHTKGYGEGIAAIYFSASDVAAKGMVWEGAYTTVIAGNPTLDWSGTGRPYVSSDTFTDWNDPVGNTLGTNILVLALSLSNSWGGNSLITNLSGTTTLTTYGEDYFGTSIPNLMTMQPSIFLSSSVAAYFYERDNPLTYATSIDHTYWTGTWLDFADVATAWDIDASFVYGGIWAAITITLLVLLAVVVRPQFEILLLLGGVMTVFGTLLHFVPMQVPVLIGVALVILFVFKHFLSPSGA